MTWPFAPLRKLFITSDFGSDRGGPNTRRPSHNGVDFRAAVGTPVYAVDDGEVRRAKDTLGAGGKEIILLLDDGSRAGYSHLSRLDVEVGELVKAGQRIGLSGNTGRSTGPHLHFTAAAPGARLGSTNPMDLIPQAADTPAGSASGGTGTLIVIVLVAALVGLS